MGSRYLAPLKLRLWRQKEQEKRTDSKNELAVSEDDRAFWHERELALLRVTMLKSARRWTNADCSAVRLQLPRKVNVELTAVCQHEYLL